MKTAQEQRDANRLRKKAERARYVEAGLSIKEVRIAKNPDAVAELHIAVAKINRKYS